MVLEWIIKDISDRSSEQYNVHANLVGLYESWYNGNEIEHDIKKKKKKKNKTEKKNNKWNLANWVVDNEDYYYRRIKS